MSNFVGTPPFLNLFLVAMETMHFLIAQTGLFLDNFFCIKGVLIKKNDTHGNLFKSAG